MIYYLLNLKRANLLNYLYTYLLLFAKSMLSILDEVEIEVTPEQVDWSEEIRIKLKMRFKNTYKKTSNKSRIYT